MHIRPARPDDYAAVDQIMADHARFHAELEPDWMTETTGISVADYHSLLSANGNLAFVAEIDDRVAGVVFLGRGAGIDPGQKYRPVYWVSEIAVAADSRDSGIGRALMAHAEATLRNLGAKALCLDVWSSNARARHLYDDMGYKTFRHRMFKPL